MEQRVWTGSLDGVTTEYDPHSATLFILGEAVKSREELAWLERKPLFGRRILLTRAKGQNQSMAEKSDGWVGRLWNFLPSNSVRPDTRRYWIKPCAVWRLLTGWSSPV